MSSLGHTTLDFTSPKNKSKGGFFNFNFNCISADSKAQASIKHETEVKPIQACRVHSGALDEINQQVFVVVVFQIWAQSPQVPRSHKTSSSAGFSCHKNGK